MKKSYSIKTKYGIFQALIWQDRRDKFYLVEVPSFDRAMTQGHTLVEAKEMAQDLINILCETALDEGKVVIDDTRRVYARGKMAIKTGPVSLAR